METRKGLPPPSLRPNHRAHLAIFHFAFFVFLVGLLIGGCASPSEPYARKPPTPQAVADLAAAQSGNSIVLSFTLPKETADHRPLEGTPAVEIYRDFELPMGAGETRPQAPAHPTLLVTIPAAMVSRYTDRGRVGYADPLHAEDFAKHPDGLAVYTVRTRVSEKKSSPNSNSADVHVYPMPDAIGDLKAEVTQAAVLLAWTAPRNTLVGSAPPISGYRIYRGEVQTAPASKAATTIYSANNEDVTLRSPLVRIGESDGNSQAFSDQQFDFGKTYAYSVRSLAQYSSQTLESDDSNLTVVTPRDTFPPAAPQSLVVVPVPSQGEVPAHVELSWAISPETDIAGYHVYRAEQAGTPGTSLNRDLLLTPAFRDMNVLPGRSYLYSVTAVDRSGNESPSSAAVSGGVPAESR
jgi:hypothetical protein